MIEDMIEDMIEEELEPNRFKLHPGADTDPHYWVSRAVNLLLAWNHSLKANVSKDASLHDRVTGSPSIDAFTRKTIKGRCR